MSEDPKSGASVPALATYLGGDLTTQTDEELAQSLLAGLDNVLHTAQSGAVGGNFLNFSADSGEWTYGPDQDVCAEDTVWLMKLSEAQHGGVLWPDQSSKDRKPIDQKMVSIGQALPPIESGWTPQFAFPMRGIGGRDDGVEVTWKTSSWGGRIACNSLVIAIKRQLSLCKQRGDGMFVNPVLQLSVKPEAKRQYGRLIRDPLLIVVDWLDRNGKAQGAALPSTPPQAPPQAAMADPPGTAGDAGRTRLRGRQVGDTA